MRTRTMPVIAAAGLAALTIAATGCGDDDNNNTTGGGGGYGGGGGTTSAPAAPGGGAAAAGGSGKSVTISETAYKLTPSDPTVSAGKVSFDVSNDGGITHALEVEGPKGEVESKDLAPGESETITVDLSKPGKYEMYCPIANHKELGMEGEVTVK